MIGYWILAGLLVCVLADAAVAAWIFLIRPRLRDQRRIARRLGL